MLYLTISKGLKRQPDGRIQFIGQADLQLKVNGFRIEAGDRAFKVKKAHVMVVNLYITPTDKDIKFGDIYPRTQVFCVPEFPLNKNRKLDAKALKNHCKA